MMDGPWTCPARPSCSPEAPARSAPPSSSASPTEWPDATIRIYSRDELKQSELAKRFGDGQLRYFIGDIRNRARLSRATQGADIVVHAAAMKQVPACEYNPFEAVQTNVLGAQHVVDAAIDAGVEQGHGAQSTDKAVNPVNIYGATKLCEEKIIVQGNAYAAQSRHPAGLRALRQRGRVARLGGAAVPRADGARAG